MLARYRWKLFTYVDLLIVDLLHELRLLGFFPYFNSVRNEWTLDDVAPVASNHNVVLSFFLHRQKLVAKKVVCLRVCLERRSPSCDWELCSASVEVQMLGHSCASPCSLDHRCLEPGPWCGNSGPNRSNSFCGRTSLRSDASAYYLLPSQCQTDAHCKTS